MNGSKETVRVFHTQQDDKTHELIEAVAASTGPAQVQAREGPSTDRDKSLDIGSQP